MPVRMVAYVLISLCDELTTGPQRWTSVSSGRSWERLQQQVGQASAPSSRSTGHSDGGSSEQGSIITTMTGNIVEFYLALHEMLRYNCWNVSTEIVLFTCGIA